MRVSCPHCAAQYDFDPSMVPAAGYDAQCSACSRTFFVAPNRAAAEAAPSSERVVSISCPTCHAIYQFAASSVPAEGYAAQCTQCSAEFFVSVPRALPATPFEPIPEPAAVLEPVLLDQPKSVPSSAGSTVAAAASPVVPPVPQVVLPPAVQPAPALSRPFADPPGVGDELGNADPAPSDIEDDFAAILGAQRRRRTVAMALVVLVAAVPLGAYALAPKLFDATLGAWLGLKAPVAASLHAEVDDCARLLLEDTATSRAAASSRLDAVLAADPWFARAAALWAVAQVLDATTLSPGAVPATDPARRLDDAAKVLARLSERFPEEPVLLEARALHAIADPTGSAVAQGYWDRAVRQALGADGALTAESAPTPWTLYVRALIEATRPDGLVAAAETLAQLIAREPTHARAKQQRARWLAELEQKRMASTPAPVVAPSAAPAAPEAVAPAKARAKLKSKKRR